MGRRGPRIEPRRVIFIGTEGRSERAFVRFLQRCCDEAGLRMHLRVKSGSGGGSVAVIRDAARYLKRLGREDIGAKLVLLDRDRVTRDQREGRDVRAEASKAKLEIIFQDPRRRAAETAQRAGKSADRCVFRKNRTSKNAAGIRQIGTDRGSVAPAFLLSRRAACGPLRRTVSAAPRNSGALRVLFTGAIVFRPLPSEVTLPQRLVSIGGECLRPLDSGFRRNDERGNDGGEVQA